MKEREERRKKMNKMQRLTIEYNIPLQVAVVKV